MHLLCDICDNFQNAKIEVYQGVQCEGAQPQRGLQRRSVPLAVSPTGPKAGQDKQGTMRERPAKEPEGTPSPEAKRPKDQKEGEFARADSTVAAPLFAAQSAEANLKMVFEALGFTSPDQKVDESAPADSTVAAQLFEPQSAEGCTQRIVWRRLPRSTLPRLARVRRDHHRTGCNF